MRLPERITEAWLKRPHHHACQGQVDLFVSRWPNGCDFTPENILEAASIGLTVSWLDFLLEKQASAKWNAERDGIYAKWNAERDGIYAKWNAERDGIYAKRQAELAPILTRYLWPTE